MFIVGLTGGIASGKSEAAKIFQKLGARVIDADTISRDVMLPQTECWQKVTAVFGKEIVKEDLTIDREKLASIVFADQQKRLHLNSLVHPAIMHQIEAIVARIEEEEPESLVIIDAALLVETGAYRSCEKLIVMCAAEETQLKRLVERDGMSREAAQKRIDAQFPLGEKVKVADYVIKNDGSLEKLQTETMRVFQSLLSLQSSETL
jgi:dephospho-CoA kinase